jgi:hypothetical protein
LAAVEFVAAELEPSLVVLLSHFSTSILLLERLSFAAGNVKSLVSALLMSSS